MENFEQTSQIDLDKEKIIEEINYEAHPEREIVDKTRVGDYGSQDSVKKLAEEENVYRDKRRRDTMRILLEAGVSRDKIRELLSSKKRKKKENEEAKLFSDKSLESKVNQKEKSTDALTGCSNRRAMEKTVPRILDLERRDGKNSSILMIDIDKFKNVNDEYGHGTGDEVLKEVVAVIKETIRKSDFTFRYGGEEFVIFLANASLDQSHVLAEKIRKKVEELKVSHKEKIIDPTISIGCMSTSELDRWLSEDKNKDLKEVMNDLIDKADTAMYYSKKHKDLQTGEDRNKTTNYTPEVNDWVKAEAIREKLKNEETK